MARLFLTKTFQKRYEQLDKNLQERIKKAVQAIKDDPHIGKPLTGDLAGEFSFRVGQYRIMFTIDGHDVWVEAVGHRREVYRRKR